VKKKHAEPAPAAEAEESAATASRDTEAELERLRAREDELLRTVAEYQNINRRRRQDVDTALKYAAEPFLLQLLPVLDDLERALQAFPSADDPHRTGVALVQDHLTKILEREGLEPIRPHREPFDPTLHDAIAHLPVANAVPGTVVEVAVPGYRFRDRVLRHAKVVVAADPVDHDEPASGGDAAERDDQGAES